MGAWGSGGWAGWAASARHCPACFKLFFSVGDVTVEKGKDVTEEGPERKRDRKEEPLNCVVTQLWTGCGSTLWSSGRDGGLMDEAGVRAFM